MNKSAIGIILSRVAGFIIFLILLGIASFIEIRVNNADYSTIVSFFYRNINLLLTMTIIGTAGEIFWNLSFPFNVLAPIASAFLGRYIVAFLYGLLNIVGLNNITSKYPISTVSFWVFVIIIVAGYLTILVKLVKKDERVKSKEEIEEEMDKRRLKEAEKWEEIGQRIRDSVKNSLEAVKDAFTNEKNKNNTKNKKNKRKK